MQPLVLDAEDKSITAKIGGAATTNELIFTAHFADATDTALTEASNDGLTNGVTPVDVVPAPAADTRRVVKCITIYNADTVAQTVTLALLHGANSRTLRTQEIEPGKTWIPMEEAVAAAAAGGSGASNPTALAVDTDEATVANTNLETTMKDITIPAGALGLKNVLDVRMRVRMLNNTGSAQYASTLRVKYGGTLIAQHAMGLNNSANYGIAEIKLRLKADGATNMQKCSSVDTGQGGDQATTSNVYYATAAVDSTADQYLRITMQPLVANANLAFTLLDVTVDQYTYDP